VQIDAEALQGKVVDFAARRLQLSSRINDINPRRSARKSVDIIIVCWRGRSSGIAISALMVPGRSLTDEAALDTSRAV
jgi:hypothetical protein